MCANDLLSPQLQLFFVLLCTLQDRFRGELEDATWLLRSCNLADSIDTNMGKWSPHMTLSPSTRWRYMYCDDGDYLAQV